MKEPEPEPTPEPEYKDNLPSESMVTVDLARPSNVVQYENYGQENNNP